MIDEKLLKDAVAIVDYYKQHMLSESKHEEAFETVLKAVERLFLYPVEDYGYMYVKMSDYVKRSELPIFEEIKEIIEINLSYFEGDHDIVAQKILDRITGGKR